MSQMSQRAYQMTTYIIVSMIKAGTNGQPETGKLGNLNPTVVHVLNQKAVDLFQIREIFMLWITDQPVLSTTKHLTNQ